MSDDGHVPGTAGLHLAARLALLRLGEQAFTAMLDGWRAQQMTSRLSPSSPTQPPQEHQTLPAHVQTARPANSVDVEQHRGAGAGSVRTSAISGVVGGGCRHWVAGFLGAFGQEQQRTGEEAHRTYESAQIRALGVVQLAGRRVDVAGYRRHAECD